MARRPNPQLTFADAEFRSQGITLDKTLQADPGYCYAYFQKAKMFIEKGEGANAREVLSASTIAEVAERERAGGAQMYYI